MGYIYCITNLINEKKYVGKTTYSITKRFQEHCKDSKKERCERRPLYNAMTECAAKMHCSVDTVKKVLTINNIPIRHNRRGCCSDPKKVEQYSLEGVFIKEWESITLAAHWLVDNGYAKTYNSGVKQKIRLCMRGENKTAYKFIWK